MLVRNLSEEKFQGKFYLATQINRFYEDSNKQDAYALSMPLLLSAMMANKPLYHKIYQQMQIALKSLPPEKNAFKAWLYGRILQAAESIGADSNAAEARDAMQTLLKDMPVNEFSTWARAYLAGSKTGYDATKATMLEACAKLNEIYKAKINTDAEFDALSSAAWGWVMALQAAANAMDKISYYKILTEMQQLTEQNTIVDSITKGVSASDFPAWAMSIVQLAAARIGDNDTYNQLEALLRTAIESAYKKNRLGEALLAEVNGELAIAQIKLNNKKLDPDPSTFVNQKSCVIL